ncbi:DUF2188 domain-containing protein [Cupriavidus pinatubonensis]|uniref:DUF2188 domain-containing protein n=1 Tax=Cupriavidus pinatubonensis TaxID=248026 RepID=UPI00280A7B43|nr:DUF2188 domain-containing protein [Cupriavidus pinatubonensis]
MIMTSRNIHVMPDHDRGWAVTVEGPNGATVLFPTEAEAIAAGTDAAKQDGVELFIHDRDGWIRERNSFEPVKHCQS